MEAPFPQFPTVGTEKNSPTGQAAGEAKAGRLGETDNEPGGRIFPALRVATPAVSRQNAMTTVGN